MSSRSFPSEDPCLYKMMIFPCPNVCDTLTILFKAAASHLSLWKFLIFLNLGMHCPVSVFFFPLFRNPGVTFFYFFCLVIVPPVAGFWVALGSGPLPSRGLPDTGQSLTGESMSICWSKDLGLNLSFIWLVSWEK